MRTVGYETIVGLAATRRSQWERRILAKRLKHKAPLVYELVWNAETLMLDNLIAVQQYIKIDCSGAFIKRTTSVQGCFNVLDCIQKWKRLEQSFDLLVLLSYILWCLSRDKA